MEPHPGSEWGGHEERWSAELASRQSWGSGGSRCLEQASCQTKWLLSVDVEDRSGGGRNRGVGSFGVDALRSLVDFLSSLFFLFLPFRENNWWWGGISALLRGHVIFG